MAPLDNRRVSRNADYTVAAIDNGATLALIANGFFRINFSAAATYPEDFQVRVINEDQTRGKLVDLGTSKFILWPQQAATIYHGGDAMLADPPQQRWKISHDVTLYVSPSGSDILDGLAPGAGACRTIGAALDVVRRQIDTSNYMPRISLAPGTYEEEVRIVGTPVAKHQVQIHGDTASPSSYVLRAPLGKNAITATDWGILTIRGVRFESSGNGQTAIAAFQFAVVDIDSVEFGPFPLGIHMSAEYQAAINIDDGGYKITGDATLHMRSNFGSRINLGGAPVTIPLPLSFTLFAGATNGMIVAGPGVYTGAGVAGTTGQRYLAEMNGIIDSQSTIFPGNVAGATSTGGQYR